jgi:hypothetical protein
MDPQPMMRTPARDFALGIAGFDRAMAYRYPTELPSLTGMGWQLCGIWLVYFAMIGVAIASMAGLFRLPPVAVLGVPIPAYLFAFPFSALAASLIIFADRMFIAADLYRDGQILYLHATGARASMMRRVYALRILTVGLRFLFGVLMSYTVVTLSLPTLLRYEVETEVIKARQSANQPLEQAFDTERRSFQKKLDDQDALIQAKDKEIAAINKRITSSTNPDSAILNDERISEFRRLIRDAEQAARIASDCADNEVTGTVDTIRCLDPPPTGTRTCGAVCQAYKRQAKTASANADAYKTDMNALIDGYNDEYQRARDDMQNAQDQLNALNAQREQLKTTRVDLKADLDAFVKQYHPQNSVNFDKMPPAGIVRVLDAAYTALANAAQVRTENTFWWLKWFLISLESIVFISRMLGNMAHGFSRELYETGRAQQAKAHKL